MGKEGEKGGAPQWGKSALGKEEASTSQRGKGTGKRKKVKEGRGRRGGAPYKEESAARGVKEKFMGSAEKEG